MRRNDGTTPGERFSALWEPEHRRAVWRPFERASAGVGVFTASKTINWDKNRTPPNPTLGLSPFVKTILGSTSFDGMTWTATAKLNLAWNDVSCRSDSWSDVSRRSDSQTDVSWSSVSWTSLSLHDVTWNDIAPADAAADSTREDAVASDVNATGGVPITTEQFLQVLCDPDVNPNPIPTSCSLVATPIGPAPPVVRVGPAPAVAP